MIQARKKYLAIMIYSICFYSVWTIFELYLKTNIDSQIIKTGVIKVLVWVLPAMLLVHHFHDSVQIGLREMFLTKVRWRRFIWVYVFLAVYVLLGGLVLQGGLSFTITLNQMIIVLFVGITEEMVFRGWLLNATMNCMPRWAAVALNVLMFLLIHFPRWICEGVLADVFTSFQFVGIIFLSVIFSVSFLKSKNILIPITMHMFYDLMIFVFLPQAL